MRAETVGTRLAAAGVDVDAQIAFDAALDSSLFAGLSVVTRALHVCRGNAPGGRWHSTGGYGTVSAQLFPRLEVDRLLLEYDTERAGAFGPLADVTSGVVAVLGLLTTKSGDLEDESAVRERIAEAATVKPLAMGVGTSHGPLLNTPPAEWEQRAKADRRNKELIYRGDSYDFDGLRAARGRDFSDECSMRCSAVTARSSPRSAMRCFARKRPSCAAGSWRAPPPARRIWRASSSTTSPATAQRRARATRWAS